MVQLLSRKPPAPGISHETSEERDLSFSVRKSAISIEPFDKKKAARAFIRGLAKLEPRLELAREGLRYDLPPQRRMHYSEVILRKGSSADVSAFVRHSLHCPRFDDDLIAYEREKVPAALQMKVAKRIFQVSEMDRSAVKGFVLSAWILSTSAAASAVFTEFLQPGKINIDLLFEPGWNVSKVFSFFFAAGILAQAAIYAVLKSLNARRIRTDARDIMGSGKITDPVAKEVLKEIAGG